jgi:hypothetical protein
VGRSGIEAHQRFGREPQSDMSGKYCIWRSKHNNKRGICIFILGDSEWSIDRLLAILIPSINVRSSN